MKFPKLLYDLRDGCFKGVSVKQAHSDSSPRLGKYHDYVHHE